MDLKRYLKQMKFKTLGQDGQKKLLNSKVLIVGCGGLGGFISQMLIRSGVGNIILMDGDKPDLSNLHRQILFTEEDLNRGISKAESGKIYLSKINSQINIEAHSVMATAENLELLMDGVDLVMDATDNFDIRYIINDLAIKKRIPWIYAGVIGSSGMSMTIVPGVTPCLRCIFPDKPEPGTFPTSDTEGILIQAPALAASIQTIEAIKILSGNIQSVRHTIIHFDLWEGLFLSMGKQDEEPDKNCPVCSPLRC